MKRSLLLLAIGLSQTWAQAALDLTIPAGAAGETIQTTIDAEITLDPQQMGALAYTTTVMVTVPSMVTMTAWQTTTVEGTCAPTSAPIMSSMAEAAPMESSIPPPASSGTSTTAISSVVVDVVPAATSESLTTATGSPSVPVVAAASAAPSPSCGACTCFCPTDAFQAWPAVNMASNSSAVAPPPPPPASTLTTAVKPAPPPTEAAATSEASSSSASSSNYSSSSTSSAEPTSAPVTTSAVSAAADSASTTLAAGINISTYSLHSALTLKIGGRNAMAQPTAGFS